MEIAARVAMDIMECSTPAMLVRYGHVTDTMPRDVARRMDAHFWGEKTEPEDGAVRSQA